MPDFTPRPTVYKGIQMRSRLEASFAGWLDRMHLEWEYEPWAVSDEQGQYLPDFVIKRALLSSPRENVAVDVAVEVKPTEAVIDYARLLRASKQIATSVIEGGLTVASMLVLVIADRAATFGIFPNVRSIESSSQAMPMAWIYDDERIRSGPKAAGSVLLTFGAMEPPFEKDWWK